MPLIIRVKVQAFGPDQVFTEKGRFTRKFARCAKEAYEAMGSLWHDKILPLHFEKVAKHRYGYKPRSAKYRKRKKNAGRGDTDLVFTGDMRDQMQHMSIRAYPTRATVTVSAPFYMTLKPNTFTGSNQPDKFKELSGLTGADYKQLETKLQTTIERAMKR